MFPTFSWTALFGSGVILILTMLQTQEEHEIQAFLQNGELPRRQVFQGFCIFILIVSNSKKVVDTLRMKQIVKLEETRWEEKSLFSKCRSRTAAGLCPQTLLAQNTLHISGWKLLQKVLFEKWLVKNWADKVGDRKM